MCCSNYGTTEGKNAAPMISDLKGAFCEVRKKKMQIMAPYASFNNNSSSFHQWEKHHSASMNSRTFLRFDFVGKLEVF